MGGGEQCLSVSVMMRMEGRAGGGAGRGEQGGRGRPGELHQEPPAAYQDPRVEVAYLKKQGGEWVEEKEGRREGVEKVERGKVLGVQARLEGRVEEFEQEVR